MLVVGVGGKKLRNSLFESWENIYNWKIVKFKLTLYWNRIIIKIVKENVVWSNTVSWKIKYFVSDVAPLILIKLKEFFLTVWERERGYM